MASYAEEKATPSLEEKSFEPTKDPQALAKVGSLIEDERPVTPEEEKLVLRKIDWVLMPLMMFSVMREYRKIPLVFCPTPTLSLTQEFNIQDKPFADFSPFILVIKSK